MQQPRGHYTDKRGDTHLESGGQEGLSEADGQLVECTLLVQEARTPVRDAELLGVCQHLHLAVHLLVVYDGSNK